MILTLTEAQDLVRRYSFGGGVSLLAPELLLYGGMTGIVRLSVRVTVPERTSGLLVDVGEVRSLAAATLTADGLHIEIRQILEAVLLHELEESLRFDGGLLADAHT